MRKTFDDKLLPALFCLFDVNAGALIIAPFITNAKRPWEKKAAISLLS